MVTTWKVILLTIDNSDSQIVIERSLAALTPSWAPITIQRSDTHGIGMVALILSG